MKKILLVTTMLAIAVVAAPTGLLAHEGEKHDDTVTVQGEVLDMACYMGHGAKGSEHAACAKRCVKGGQPMGLLAEDGTVYLLYADHEDSTAFDETKEFAGTNVEITGKPAGHEGSKGIEVHQVKQL